ncbi:hypothetical protein [Nitrospirillum sp. BR 11163]|uniref:hypothetical protein n=1 Tax=Nitrospirillum sp. BR 11163 TaxID=3104323 RepID=UPI002AFDD288|nr:hypothetical protein [Nitrospirillum sp. BR 11163]MEA1672982.1 hypothetical protein [Nitrospirillum sp. BR 11163]
MRSRCLKVLPFACSLSLAATVALAEPTSTVPGQVLQVRPYMNPDDPCAFIVVDNTSLCGVSTFKISLRDNAGLAALSVAITSMTTGKPVTLEVSNATGCQGANSLLQSIYLQR